MKDIKFQMMFNFASGETCEVFFGDREDLIAFYNNMKSAIDIIMINRCLPNDLYELCGIEEILAE